MMNESCPCCGEFYYELSDGDDRYTSGSSSGSASSSSDESELDEATTKGRSRMNLLLMQNAKAKVLMQKNKYYNKILDTQQIVRDEQLMVLQRANTLNGMFVRNMEAIMRLGYCPLVLQQRSESISRGLLDVHKMIQRWDERLEDVIPVPKSKGQEHNALLLPSLLQVFKAKYGTDIEAMTDAQFEDALKKSMAIMPQLLPDEAGIKAALEDMDLYEIELEWDNFENKVELHLHKLEVDFVNLCVEFGIRVRLPQVEGYEWAHAAGPLRRRNEHGNGGRNGGGRGQSGSRRGRGGASADAKL